MEEKKLTYKDVPTGYPLCFNHECTKKTYCMHYQAQLLLPKAVLLALPSILPPGRTASASVSVRSVSCRKHGASHIFMTMCHKGIRQRLATMFARSLVAAMAPTTEFITARTCSLARVAGRNYEDHRQVRQHRGHPFRPLRDGLGLRLECEKKNQRVKTRPTDYCFVYLRIRGAVPSNDDDTSHINSLTLVHLSSLVRPLWRVVRITATEHFTLLYFDYFCRRFYISFLHRITSFLPL